KTARRIPARRISARTWNDRHGRAPQGAARDARPPDRLSGARKGGLIPGILLTLSFPRTRESMIRGVVTVLRLYHGQPKERHDLYWRDQRHYPADLRTSRGAIDRLLPKISGEASRPL